MLLGSHKLSVDFSGLRALEIGVLMVCSSRKSSGGRKKTASNKKQKRNDNDKGISGQMM